jgi:hypothetical protein
MALEVEFFIVRFLSLLSIAILASIGLFYGAKVLTKLKGEFGIGVKWMTIGFGLMAAAAIEAFPLLTLLPEGTPERLAGEVGLAIMFSGAFAMAIYGYEKIYKLISELL